MQPDVPSAPEFLAPVPRGFGVDSAVRFSRRVSFSWAPLVSLFIRMPPVRNTHPIPTATHPIPKTPQFPAHPTHSCHPPTDYYTSHP
ncbi:unnamed protein product [Prunus armeniaca]|uniref:Uncharacterized protein n=1 Tax=Prunus armeniaca TaxID=36596 RepID=A0A6J5UA26_PRUAR|nr:unnamed protein product [Prunus armeniaca]